MPRISRSTYFLFGFVVVLTSIGGYWASQLINHSDINGNTLPTTLKQATVLPEDFRQVPEFTMRDQRGANVGRELFLDHWSLVFFGYTHCPDVCLVSLSVLKQARQLIAASAPTNTPRIVFVSIDPRRDTPGQLQSYLADFDKSFIGLNGTEAETQRLTRALGIAYKIGDNTDIDYLVDHSTAFLLIGPTGGLRAILSAPHDPLTIASDYRIIVGANL